MLVLCDPRLTRQIHGRIFLDSLPPFPRTRALADVQAFFGREGFDHRASNGQMSERTTDTT